MIFDFFLIFNIFVIWVKISLHTSKIVGAFIFCRHFQSENLWDCLYLDTILAVIYIWLNENPCKKYASAPTLLKIIFKFFDKTTKTNYRYKFWFRRFFIKCCQHLQKKVTVSQCVAYLRNSNLYLFHFTKKRR